MPQERVWWVPLGENDLANQTVQTYNHTNAVFTPVGDLGEEWIQEYRTSNHFGQPSPQQSTDERFDRLCQKQRLWGNEAFRFYHRLEHAWLAKERKTRTQREARPTPERRGPNTSVGYYTQTPTTQWSQQMQVNLTNMNSGLNFVAEAMDSLTSTLRLDHMQP